MRAQGGFLVSAEQKDREVVKLEVKSTVGGTLRVLSPWKTITVNGKMLTPDEKGIVSIETQKGQRIVLARSVDSGVRE